MIAFWILLLLINSCRAMESPTALFEPNAQKNIYFPYENYLECLPTELYKELLKYGGSTPEIGLALFLLKTPTVQKIWNPNIGAITCLALHETANHKTLYMGSKRGNIVGWNLNTNQVDFAQQTGFSTIASVSIHSRYKHLFALIKNLEIQQWDIASQRLIRLISHKSRPGVTAMLLDEPNNQLFFTFKDTKYTHFKTFDLETSQNETIKAIPKDESINLNCLALDPLNHHLFAGTQNALLKLDLISKKCYRSYHGDPICSVHMDNNNNQLITLSPGKVTIYHSPALYNAKAESNTAWDAIFFFKAKDDALRADFYSYSPSTFIAESGNCFILGNCYGTIKWCNLSHNVNSTLRVDPQTDDGKGNYPSQINSLIQTSNGSYIFAGFQNGEIAIIDTDAQMKKDWESIGFKKHYALMKIVQAYKNKQPLDSKDTLLGAWYSKLPEALQKKFPIRK